MNKQTLLTSTAALALTFTLVGCNSSKQGKVARQDSSARMELVHAQMAFDQAEQTFATGQFDKSLKQIDTAIARSPERAEYHTLKGRIFIETNRLESAMKSFERAIELDPTRPEPHYFAGIVQQRWSDHSGAAESYRTAYDLENESVSYLLATAESLIALGDYSSARQLVEPRMPFFEHNATLRQLLGQIALLEENPDRAAELFEEARLLNPDDDMLLDDIAHAHFSAGNFAKALHAVNQLQETTDEDRPDLLHLEARCLAMLDRSSEARNVYLQLSQLSPADPVIWIELGNVALQVGDFRRVALCSARAIALAPERYEGHLLKGLYEQNEGNHQNAIEAFETAASLAKGTAWPHVLLGMSLEAIGSDDDARMAYGAALRAEPSNQQAQRRLNELDGAVYSSEAGIH